MQFRRRRPGFAVVGIGFGEFLENLDAVRPVAHFRVQAAQQEFGAAVIGFAGQKSQDPFFRFLVLLTVEVQVRQVQMERIIARIDGQNAFERFLRGLVFAQRPVRRTLGAEGLDVFRLPFQGDRGLVQGFRIALHFQVQRCQPGAGFGAARHQLDQLFQLHHGVAEVAAGLQGPFQVDHRLDVGRLGLQGLAVIADGFFVAPLVGQHHAHIVPGFGVEGVDGQDAGKHVHGFAVLAPLEVDDARIVHRLQPARTAAQGGFVGPARLFKLAFRLQGDAVVEVQGRIVPIQVESLPENLEGLVPLAQAVVHGAQVVVGRHVAGIQLDHLGVSHGGGFEVAELLVDVAQVIVELRPGRIQIDGFFQRIQRVVEPLLLAVDDRQVVEGFQVFGIAGQQRVELVRRRFQPVGPGQCRPQEQPGVAVFAVVVQIGLEQPLRRFMVAHPGGSAGAIKYILDVEGAHGTVLKGRAKTSRENSPIWGVSARSYAAIEK